MSGFSVGPFGFLGLGNTLAAPAEETRSSLSSSRRVDFVTKRYVVNDEGGFEAMDDVAQTVGLLVAFAWVPPTHVTPQARNEAKTKIRAALRSLSSGAAPLIQIRSVDVSTPGGGIMNISVTYKNLRTNTIQTVEPAA